MLVASSLCSPSVSISVCCVSQGKSSLFRIIGELWPLHSGVLIKPSKEEILFVPQKPYLVLGTLRDQIIYPHEYEDMKKLGVTDEHLAQLLAIVDPARNITTEWGWSDTQQTQRSLAHALLSSLS